MDYWSGDIVWISLNPYILPQNGGYKGKCRKSKAIREKLKRYEKQIVSEKPSYVCLNNESQENEHFFNYESFSKKKMLGLLGVSLNMQNKIAFKKTLLQHHIDSVPRLSQGLGTY